MIVVHNFWVDKNYGHWSIILKIKENALKM